MKKSSSIKAGETHKGYYRTQLAVAFGVAQLTQVDGTVALHNATDAKPYFEVWLFLQPDGNRNASMSSHQADPNQTILVNMDDGSSHYTDVSGYTHTVVFQRARPISKRQLYALEQSLSEALNGK